MPILRLAYATQFLIALIAVFVLWSEVGGQSSPRPDAVVPEARPGRGRGVLRR